MRGPSIESSDKKPCAEKGAYAKNGRRLTRLTEVVVVEVVEGGVLLLVDVLDEVSKKAWEDFGSRTSS
jgi:hypothetical protein